MKQYDRDKRIDPEDWMGLDETERASLVEQYHTKKHIKMPNVKVHAAFHVIAENQIAMGDTIPAQKALTRLMRQGLSRHNAVHAIASVAATHFFNVMKQGSATAPNEDYNLQLEKLNAEDWRNSLDESEDD